LAATGWLGTRFRVRADDRGVLCVALRTGFGAKSEIVPARITRNFGH
jgi:hypothetical protein